MVSLEGKGIVGHLDRKDFQIRLQPYHMQLISANHLISLTFMRRILRTTSKWYRWKRPKLQWIIYSYSKFLFSLQNLFSLQLDLFVRRSCFVCFAVFDYQRLSRFWSAQRQLLPAHICAFDSVFAFLFTAIFPSQLCKKHVKLGDVNPIKTLR